MTKREKLERLDNLVLDKMIEYIESGKTECIPELSSAISYLAKNNVVEEKKKSTIEEDIRKRLEEAKKRRANSGA